MWPAHQQGNGFILQASATPRQAVSLEHIIICLGQIPGYGNQGKDRVGGRAEDPYKGYTQSSAPSGSLLLVYVCSAS